MQYLSVILLLMTALASATPTRTLIDRDATPVDASLDKRACTSGVCGCHVGTPQGQYCAGGGIYECNPSGGCCYYGPSKACQGLSPSLPGFGSPKAGLGLGRV